MRFEHFNNYMRAAANGSVLRCAAGRNGVEVGHTGDGSTWEPNSVEPLKSAGEIVDANARSFGQDVSAGAWMGVTMSAADEETGGLGPTGGRLSVQPDRSQSSEGLGRRVVRRWRTNGP